MRCISTPDTNIQNTKILITKAEWEQFRDLAQARSLKVQGYLGQLIKRELEKAEEEKHDKS